MTISGLHISLLGMGFYRILQKISSVLAIIFIWLYGLMTRFGISTNRAVVIPLMSILLGVSLIGGIVGLLFSNFSFLVRFFWKCLFYFEFL